MVTELVISVSEEFQTLTRMPDGLWRIPMMPRPIFEYLKKLGGFLKNKSLIF